MNSAGVNPAVIEIEQRTDREGVVDRLIGVAHRVQRLDIRRPDVARITIDLGDEAQQGFFGFGQKGRLHVGEDAIDEFPAAQEFRRDRGVRLRSKGTGIEV